MVATLSKSIFMSALLAFAAVSGVANGACSYDSDGYPIFIGEDIYNCHAMHIVKEDDGDSYITGSCETLTGLTDYAMLGRFYADGTSSYKRFY